MAQYTPRLTDSGIYLNNYYYSENPFEQSGFGMPNCTAYAWGRWYEISGIRPDNLPLGDAKTWYPEVIANGVLQVGQTPALGAIACYDSTVGGGGHVSVVEVIYSDGSFKTSNSGYYRPISSYPPATPLYFDVDTCDAVTKKADWMGSKYTFQGFIYNPNEPVPSVPTEWVYGNRYLTKTEMENNALLVWNYFGARGWTLEAVCGMLGNMQVESTINPGLWYGFIVGGPSYGLTQWDPYTKYSNWAGEGWENNGDKQCERIQYEVDNGLQWFSNSAAPIVNPPITFREFSVSTLDVETLANYFLWYYEHPADAIQPVRAKNARRWYEFLSGVTPYPTRKKKMPIWMYLRRF